jgi:hypothetical protein
MKILYHFSLILLLLATGCNVYTDVSSTSAESADYLNYHSFAWLPDDMDTTNLPYHNSVIRNNIRNYFSQNFSERGYALNLDTPDVLLQLVIVNNNKETRIIYKTHPEPYYYHKYFYGSMYYYPYTLDYYYRNKDIYCYPSGYCSRKVKYIESSITLNVFDRKKNTLIWSGTAKGNIYDPAYIKRSIHPAIESIMKRYPVKKINPRDLIKNTEVDLTLQ